MILLTSTSDKLRLVTGSAGDVRVQASYVDLNGSTVTPGRLNTAISTATTTDIVASPGASTQRNVKYCSIWNDHATDANRVTIQHTDGTTTVDIYTVSLPAQAGLVYVDGQGWTVYGAARPTNIQTFSANDTWYVPTSFTPTVVMVRIWGAGGGGGGGASLATAVVAKGGGGGGGGCFVERIFRASDLTNSISVTIGAGGSAGSGAAAGGSGGAGGIGGNSTFGAYLTAYGGGGGAGGGNSAVATGGGGGGGGHGAGSSGSTSGGSGGLPATVGPGWDIQGVTGSPGTGATHYGWFGGGGGGGTTNATTPAGASGGGSIWGGGGGGFGGCHSNVPGIVNAGGGGGVAAGVGTGGTAGTSGATPTAGGIGAATNGVYGGSGGGGGGSTVTVATDGARGGNGGNGGGGGGGGGVGTNLGGVGGNGGDGYGVIITW